MESVIHLERHAGSDKPAPDPSRGIKKIRKQLDRAIPSLLARFSQE